jgi:acyl-CoA-binding protein
MSFEVAAEANRLASSIPGIELIYLRTEKLKLYALFKQSTQGPADEKNQPSWWDTASRYKFDAWKALGDLDSISAKKEYIKLSKLLLQSLSDSKEIQKEIQKLKGNSSSQFFQQLPNLLTNLSLETPPDLAEDCRVKEKTNDLELSLMEDLKSLSSDHEHMLVWTEIQDLKKALEKLEQKVDRQDSMFKNALLVIGVVGFLLGRLELLSRYKK